MSTPDLDADLLLARALGWSRARVLAEPRCEISEATVGTLALLLARRCRREPLSYVLGEREFWSIPFLVDPRALVPRPESETLIEAALARLGTDARAGTWRIADVGTGSGAIALALASELGPGTCVVGLDRSAGALDLARANHARLSPRSSARVQLVRSDLLAGVRPGALDLVVSNPPYLSDAELRDAPPELAFEPREALAGGGPEGLSLVLRLLEEAREALRPGGWLIVEIGASQGLAVADRAEKAGFADVAVLPDLAGRDRALVARRRECTV